ncbi:hypothetical protein SAMN04488527_10267 [Aliiroseovarius crassostreae]|uniref:Porin domain-containing protein n=1 Tax=Aliiroseovarius crassostreae TaxID=154981 RepID=A0A0P7IH66_9RHOB|nr:hypothetical protein [Aliiroseovarius crassostreae]KPN63278.1 hypothetical protein AKJ29_11365 [Aliiroseovarius crassostreae]SFU40833.1 hypothetical protein SAMN04488527_10267 [Aliiroseovarius crassostreae]
MTNLSKCLLASGLAFTAAFPAQAELSFSGSIGASVGTSAFLNSDEEYEYSSEDLFKLDGQLRAEMGNWAFMIDASHFGRDLDGKVFSDYAPSRASALGLHAGYMWGENYVGVFAGRNWFQGEEAGSVNGTESGNLYGIEGQFELANGTTGFFGQLGRAELAGDDRDTGFEGTFVRLGMTQAITDKLNLMIDLEYGRSSDLFEDEEDWGDYKSVGIKAAYAFQPRLIGEAGIDLMNIAANEEDHGNDYRAYLGVRIPFGAEGAKISPLTTTYKPGLAAAWAEALD